MTQAAQDLIELFEGLVVDRQRPALAAVLAPAVDVDAHLEPEERAQVLLQGHRQAQNWVAKENVGKQLGLK